jgi:NhaA family Na+:H+ antiporter
MVACLTLLQKRVPTSFRALLLSLAVVDDLGAVLVIALGCSENLYLTALLIGLAGIAFMMFTAWLGVRSVPIYLLLGIAIWFAFHESGVHASVIGVII